jgi:gliding motility-associated protein GldM
MAGGKETPRQKMIGMMYLVLTALLALNVSTTVLEKFIFLNDALEKSNVESNERNSQTLEAMKRAVQDKGSTPEKEKILKDADALRAETLRVVEELEKYKDIFVNITGGYETPEDEKNRNRAHIKGKTDYDKVGNYMMPKEEHGEGHGEIMENLLNDFAAFAREMVTRNGGDEEELKHYGKLALHADEDPIYSRDPNQKGKKFSQLAFESSPTHAGLATVSEFQSSVLSLEARTLKYLADRTGQGDLVFNEIVAMVNPVSKYVIAGAEYEADMFIAASNTALVPKMSYDGKEIPVTSGIGKLKFTASLAGGTSVGNGVVKKTYTAAISVPAAGKDTTFKNTIEYFVVTPAIVISSNTAVALYRNCANELRVDVPGLSGNYNPNFTVEGGQGIRGGGVGEINVVPNSSARKVVLTVTNAGQTIGSKDFTVKEIPAPMIRVMDGANEVNPSVPISPTTRALRIDAKADADFEGGHPKDARFVVLEGEASHLSGGLVRKKIPFTNGNLDLSSLAGQIRKGDVITIEIKRVGRRNFQNQDENFPRFPKFLPPVTF